MLTVVKRRVLGYQTAHASCQPFDLLGGFNVYNITEGCVLLQETVVDATARNMKI